MDNNIKFARKNSLLIISLLTIILLIIPGIFTYYVNNFTYQTGSFTWSQDQTQLAFVRADTRNPQNLGEIMIWSSSTKSFTSIGFITTETWDSCKQYPFALCIPSYGFQITDINKFYPQFCSDNKVLVGTFIGDQDKFVFPYPYQIFIFAINLTTKSLISQNLFEINLIGPNPTIGWSNGQLLYPTDQNVIDLLTNNTIYNYNNFNTISTPVLSQDGQKIAFSKLQFTTNGTFAKSNLVIIDLKSKTIQNSILDPGFIIPYAWNNNNSELLFQKNDYFQNTSFNGFNYTIINIISNKTIFTENFSKEQYLYYFTPDFRLVTIEDYSHYVYPKNTNDPKYITINTGQKTNITVNGSIDYSVIDPNVKFAYTGYNNFFQITNVLSSKNYFTYSFNENERNIGLFSSIIGTCIILLILIYKYRNDLKYIFFGK